MVGVLSPRSIWVVFSDPCKSSNDDLFLVLSLPLEAKPFTDGDLAGRIHCLLSNHPDAGQSTAQFRRFDQECKAYLAESV